MPVVNAAAYRFLALDRLKELRAELTELCRRLALKGTILLAPEGLNLCVAGSAGAVDELLARLPLEPGHIKFSTSEHQPYTRMLVRLKKEIIAFGRPTTHTAPRLAPRQLKEWLDEGRPLTLLDTRNDYEVRMGTFRGALDLNLSHFREFPEAAQSLGHLKDTPIVTFCTGGIRCEKAAPWLEDQGFTRVFQLDGGILRYFEEVGGAYYDGECFVFDRRVGVDPALQETDSVVCPVCLAPLNREQQADPRYRRGQSCPHCFRDALEVYQQALQRVSQRPPGSQPAENRIPLNIPARCQGMSLREALPLIFPQVEDWSNLRDANGSEVDWERPLHAGERYLRIQELHVEPPVCTDIQLLYLDEALLLINKPAPLPMHPCGRFERNTLRHLLALAFAPEVPRPAHRLDANTTGLVVCARSHHFATRLHPQFAEGCVEKCYLALVHGHPEQAEFEVDLPIATEAGPAGLRTGGQGAPAVTRFRILERRPDTTLLQAQPLTGRTNQIRVHLWSLGHPVLGDPSYLPDGRRAARQTLTPEDPPMHLHSWKVRLRHPLTGADFRFECPIDWAAPPPLS
ncbi:MAG: pseudouridine synthase [Candidatus Eremiobacteraeota bacterium]|nr:pseudouridine synthase [Candidatus Eremiobacteraeota bacterium]MCW5867678.1 pseudouridine synthase [Candidatus Eremiobacteraeota bacterium]